MLSPVKVACLCMLALTLSSCGTFPADEIDPAGNLSREDYLALRNRGMSLEDAIFEGGDKDEENIDPSDLKMPPIPSIPMPLVPEQSEKLISLSVSENIPLRSVLMDLAREGEVNLELDPRIEGGIIFSAYNQPFDDVLRRICALAGLRARQDGNFLRVELDTPFQKTYAVDYLSLKRTTTSEISISTNVFEAGDGQNGSSSNNGKNNSTSKILAVSETGFWSDLEKSLKQLLDSTQKYSPLIRLHKQAKESSPPSFSIDRQAGLVTIFGTEHQHTIAKIYLDRLKSKATAQVLIEARIVEVELSDAFQSGINWRSLFGSSVNAAARFGTVGAGAPFALATTASDGFFTASIDNSDFSGILSLVRTFGATRILSSPRLTVLNNQTAVMKVARNEVYFVTSAQFPTTVNTSGVTVSGNPVFSSTPHTVPVGLVMTVQPSINQAQGRITMTLRPTISRVVDRIEDPSIGLNAAQTGNSTTASSKIPVLAVREMDSVLQLDSGKVVVMGGLMQDTSDNTDKGVPPFDNIPLLGNLAKSRDNNGKTTELVILLRATILDNPEPDAADKDLYFRYNRDPRPILDSAN